MAIPERRLEPGGGVTLGRIIVVVGSSSCSSGASGSGWSSLWSDWCCSSGLARGTWYEPGGGARDEDRGRRGRPHRVNALEEATTPRVEIGRDCLRRARA